MAMIESTGTKKNGLAEAGPFSFLDVVARL